MSLIKVTPHKAPGKVLVIGSTGSVHPTPNKVLDDSDNVSKTLYHHEANIVGFQLDKLPKKK